MPPLRFGPLQWAVSSFCVTVGTLMLITPHQFASRTFLLLQPALPWWGAGFLLAGAMLLAVAVLLPRRGLTVLAHLGAGVALLALAYAFTVNSAWTGTTNYLILGLGTLLAPLLAGQGASGRGEPRDMYTLLMGLAGALTGLVMLLLPGQFSSPSYDLVRPFLPAHGLAFLAGGLVLLGVVVHRPTSRRALRLAHLLAGGAYLVFCLSFAIPNRGLPAITLYGGLGGLLAGMPWLAPQLRRIDPARLQTRLALALAALAAVPLLFGVALATAQEERAATELALSRQQTLANSLAGSTSAYVAQHRDAVEALALELALAGAAPEAQRPLLERFQRAYDEINTFNSYDAAGNPVARGDGRALGPPVGASPLFATARQTLGPAVQVATAPMLQLPVVAIGAPVLDAQGRFAGLVIGAFDTARLAEKAAQAATLQVGEIYLVDDRGRVIAHPDSAIAAAFTDRSAADPVTALRERGQSGHTAYPAADGQRLAGFAPVADLGWGVIVDRPAAAVLAGVRAGRELTLSLLVLVLGTAIGVGIVLAQTLAVPLALLVDATRALAAGEGTAPLPRSRIREVATLADTVAHLRDSLAARTGERDRAELRLRLLAEAGGVLAGSLDVDTTLRRISAMLVPTLADWGSVYLRRDDGSITLAAVAHVDPNRTELARELHTRYPVDPGATAGVANVLRTGRPELTPEITDAMLMAVARDSEHLELLRAVGFQALMIVPLHARDGAVGALVLVSSDPARRYGPEDLALAEDLGRRAGLAVENARLYRAERDAREAAERATARMTRLQGVTAALSGALTPEAVAEVIVTQGAAALDAQAGLVALMKADGSGLTVVRAVGYPEGLIGQFPHIPLDAPLPLAEAARSGVPVLVSSAEEGRMRYPELAAAQAQTALQAWANIPLALDQRCVGALELSFAQPRAFSAEERAFLQTLGEQCAQAIERARLYATEQRARTEAEAAVRVREQFLSIAAHELKTPLTPLLGQAQLLERRALRDGQIGERERRALRTMASQALRLNQLVSSMLDLNRLQTGHLVLQRAPLDLSALVRRLTEELQPSLELHRFELELPDEPALVDGDSLRLEQVLQNLIQNAIKYSPAGGPVTVLVDRRADHVVLQVRDRGIGIPAEALPRLFEPFFRADNAAQSVMPGMGVGLAVVKEIVTLHHGSVTAASIEGQGSIFTVTLSALPAEGVAASDMRAHRAGAGLLP